MHRAFFSPLVAHVSLICAASSVVCFFKDRRRPLSSHPSLALIKRSCQGENDEHERREQRTEQQQEKDRPLFPRCAIDIIGRRETQAPPPTTPPPPPRNARTQHDTNTKEHQHTPREILPHYVCRLFVWWCPGALVPACFPR